MYGPGNITSFFRGVFWFLVSNIELCTCHIYICLRKDFSWQATFTNTWLYISVLCVFILKEKIIRQKKWKPVWIRCTRVIIALLFCLLAPTGQCSRLQYSEMTSAMHRGPHGLKGMEPNPALYKASPLPTRPWNVFLSSKYNVL